MNTAGTYFLRTAPMRVARPEGGFAWRMALGEREPGGGTFCFSAGWHGPQADEFSAAHPHLRAGDCLVLRLSRPRVHGDELCWRIEQAAVAPPRWPASAATRCAATEAAGLQPAAA